MPNKDRSDVSCIRYMPSIVGFEYLLLNALYVDVVEVYMAE